MSVYIFIILDIENNLHIFTYIQRTLYISEAIYYTDPLGMMTNTKEWHDVSAKVLESETSPLVRE